MEQERMAVTAPSRVGTIPQSAITELIAFERRRRYVFTLRRK